MNLKVSQAELASEEERIELQGMEERNLLVREKLAELYNQTRRACHFQLVLHLFHYLTSFHFSAGFQANIVTN